MKEPYSSPFQDKGKGGGGQRALLNFTSILNRHCRLLFSVKCQKYFTANL